MNNIGCHVSMKAPDYLTGAVREALSYKADALMIYTGPPQNTMRKPVEQFHIEEAQTLLKQAGIPLENIIVHAPYIINLANTVNPATFELGVSFLKQELVRTARIGARYLVLHPGCSLKADADRGINQVIEGLNQALAEDEQDVTVCLETMAGKGSEIGITFEQLARIREGVIKKDRIAFCLDTCHIHDAGYNVSEWDEVMDHWDKVIGMDLLKVIHLNDSRNPRGAHKDRHANLGEGEIGFDALLQVAQDRRLERVVKILETPFVEGHAPYALEIQMLKEGVYDPCKLDSLRK